MRAADRHGRDRDGLAHHGAIPLRVVAAVHTAKVGKIRVRVRKLSSVLRRVLSNRQDKSQFLSPLIFTKVKIRLSDLFMIGGLCILMLSSRRQVTMFVIVGSVILNRLITQLITIYNDEKYIEKMEKRATSIIGVLIISILTLCLTYYLAKDNVVDKYIDESSYPVQACDYILKYIDLGKARFYNEYNYGSYMLFRGIPVFIDSRADLYAPEFSGKSDDIFMDFIETSGIAKFYEDIFKKYDITHVITYENSKMNMIIEKTKDPNYKQLYKDDYFVVYERLSN